MTTWAPLRVKRAQYSVEQGHRLWMADYRVAASGKDVADVVQEVRPLAIGNEHRVPQAPDLPTLGEARRVVLQANIKVD